MACKCNETVDELLAEHNSQLVTTLGFGGAPCRVVLLTEKRIVKKRWQPPRMLASYCPFCGVRYVPDTADAGESAA